MHIEKQVCTYEQAKELHKLGIKGDTMLYWVDFTGFGEVGYMLCRQASVTEQEAKDSVSWIIVGDIHPDLMFALEEGACDASGGVYPAYSIAEMQTMDGSLGSIEMSHGKLLSKKGNFYRCVNSSAEIWEDRFKYYETLACAWADKLIDGLISEYCTAEEYNERLAK